ncbi:hypothetical protein ACFC0D_15195 [Streptomyces sp. NPDC056222]|uniref:hypothetical protein n=1 Tax=Streptomyces sp. NPDC056222 TaxID=3345749 RepID=UPI0035D975C3
MSNPQPPYPPQQPGHTPAWGHPQQPGQAYNGQTMPGPYGPPPPKKGMSPWAITGITIGGIFAFLVILGAIVGGDDTSDDKAAPKATATTQAPAVKAPASKTPAARPTTAPAKIAEAPKTKAPAAPADYPDGDYIIGEDIPAGTYQTPGAEAGVFELCMVSTKPTDKSVMPQLKSANKDERIIITISAKDGLLSISGCEPLKRRK